MTLTKSAKLSFLLVLGFYFSVTLWRMAGTPFPLHGDACWYDMVARNVAQGRGLVEDCVWYYMIPFETVTHPIGNLFNPLCILIVGGFYKLFGISNVVGSLPGLLMDGVVCGTIFLFSLNRLRSLPMAVLSSLIFTVHDFLLSTRSGGGFPETFLLFFATLCTYCLIWAWEGRRIHYLSAAFLGALAYLARNEGGISIAVIVGAFLYREIVLPLRSKEKPAPKTLWLGLGILAVFGLLVLPWEMRNRLLFGNYANNAKYQYFFVRAYDDIWSYSQTSSPSLFLAMGWKKILTILSTSYYYKLDAFVATTTWPLAVFLPSAILALRKAEWPRPVLIYFVISFVAMGALNTVGQSSGWNGIYVFLPFFIPMAVSGIYYFAHQLIASPKRAANVALSLGLGLVLYHGAINVRYMHRLHKTGGDTKQMTMQVIQDWFAQHVPSRPLVVMTHYAYELTYYSGIPTVKIPTHDPLDKIWEVAAKYGCTHLVMVGDNNATLHSIYQGMASDSHLEKLGAIPFRVTMGDGGDQIQIYRIKELTK